MENLAANTLQYLDIKTLMAILITILGTLVGSFLSVVLHRLRKKIKGIFFGASMCPNCRKRLKWKHLFPVLSFLILGGKCAHCGKRISFHYFGLEVLTAVVFLLTFLNFNFIESTPSAINQSLLLYSINTETLGLFLLYIIEAALMMGIFFYDLLYREIPDVLSLPAIVIAIAGSLAFQTVSPASMGIGIAIIAVFFGGQIVLSKGRWLGGGDLRLGVLLAVLLGWKLLILSLVISYILGALVSIVLLLSDKADRKTAIPFGPFLITGGIIALFYGERLISLYMNLTGLTF